VISTKFTSIEAVNSSLQALQIDKFDIIFCQGYSEEFPLLDVCQMMSSVVSKGLAKVWGTSSWPSDMITAAIEVCKANSLNPLASEQPRYSLGERDDFEESYRRVFGIYNYGSIVHSSLASGLSSDKQKKLQTLAEELGYSLS
jgi:aryl-alcohol dehydrogenase-like predicted oxidoreductase